MSIEKLETFVTDRSVERQSMIDFPSRKLLKSDLDLSDSNKHVLVALENWRNWSSKYVCIAGDKSSGKSTFARYWADATNAKFLTGHQLSTLKLNDISELAKEHIIVDDADQYNDEYPLLSLLNLLDEKARAVLTMSDDPKDIRVQSKDLKSRLTSAPTLVITAPDEDMLRLRLRTSGKRFFMRFSDSVLDYLVPRIPRDYVFLESFVQELSDVVGEYRRPPTVPLAADVLEYMQTHD